MKAFLVILAGLHASSTALAGSPTWKLKVKDTKTTEVKYYEPVDDVFNVPLADGFVCGLARVSNNQSITEWSIICNFQFQVFASTRFICSNDGKFTASNEIEIRRNAIEEYRQCMKSKKSEELCKSEGVARGYNIQLICN